MPVIGELARPKINLTLRILGRRADGYHELESLVAFADGIGDSVTLDVERPRGVTVTGPFAAGIVGANLLDKVLDEVSAAWGGARLQIGHVLLDKVLPVGAGIGGGSADAAALLRALRRADPGHAEAVDWDAIALRLGADVPVCLMNRAAWMTGIGERLQPVTGLARAAALLVNPMCAVPADKTARVFRALDAARAGRVSRSEMSARYSGDLGEFVSLVARGNDLEAAACSVVPEVSLVLDALRRTPGCRVTAMSGAGPTCFAIYDDAGAASAAHDEIRARHPGWWSAAVTLG